METLISPSLLSANFIDLRSDIDMINRSEADWLHLDIMDGVFVPNISFGFPVIQAVAKECKKPLDVHLMIVHPENYIKQGAATGAMMMNVHYEACTHLHRTVQEIHAAGMKAGVTLNPHTPVSMLEDIICDVDMVLLMSVNPGFRRTEVHTQLGREDEAPAPPHRRVGQQGSHTDRRRRRRQSAPLLVAAGADVLVSGSYVFKAADPIATIHGLKHCL